MNKISCMLYLIVFFSLNFSCNEHKPTEPDQTKSEWVSPSNIDTIKYTSGIRVIFQDSKGHYWLGSNQEGVSHYNGTTFEYFSTNEGLSGNQIYSIQEDKNGTIWFSTQNGVSSYDGKAWTNHTSLEEEAPQGEWMKKENDLWLPAGNQQGVYRYDGQQLNFLAFPNPKAISSGNIYAVTGLSKGKNNMLWIGTYAGVFGYNGYLITEINDETIGRTKGIGQLHIRSIFEDTQGRLWIGNNGIGVLMKKNGTIINFSKENNLMDPFSTRGGDPSKAGTLEHVFAIAEDSEGNIWFGDRDTGAWRFDGKSITNYIVDKRLNSPMIWSIYEDQNKNLLFGMADGGVYTFNGETFDRFF